MQWKHRDDNQKTFPPASRYPNNALRETSTRRRSRTKTLLLDATALGPAGSRGLIHCAIINNEIGDANGMVRIVSDLFKEKELAIDAACGLLNRGYGNALEVGPMLGS
jgi:hypothetical protein